MSTKPKASDAPAAPASGERVAERIFLLRGHRVILDQEIAFFFETTTARVNQYRKRNEDRFLPDFAFELSPEEWHWLRSQHVISDQLKNRRYPPWAYTEHGFAMLSMGMKGPKAAAIARVIIDTFIQFARGTLPEAPVLGGPNAPRDRRILLDAIYHQITSLAAMPLPTGAALSEELQDATRGAIESIKSMIEGPAINKEKLISEIARIEAETVRTYSEAKKTEAETAKIWTEVMQNRLQLIAQMREMALQLERDEVAALTRTMFDQTALPVDVTPPRLTGPEDHDL